MPIPAPAKRKITKGERTALDWALTTGASIDEIAQREGRTVDEVQGLLQETGITLPSQGTTLNRGEREIYLDTITNQSTAWDAAQQYGLNPTATVDRLRETGLRTPLSADTRGIYDQAQQYGLGNQDLARAFNAPDVAIDTILGGAGLSLTGERPQQQQQQQDRGVNRGTTRPLQMPTGDSFMQNPGLRMVRKNKRRSDDPNWQGTTDTILTSGRGATGDANTQVKTLLG